MNKTQLAETRYRNNIKKAKKRNYNKKIKTLKTKY